MQWRSNGEAYGIRRIIGHCQDAPGAPIKPVVAWMQVTYATFHKRLTKLFLYRHSTVEWTDLLTEEALQEYADLYDIEGGISVKGKGTQILFLPAFLRDK